MGYFAQCRVFKGLFIPDNMDLLLEVTENQVFLFVFYFDLGGFLYLIILLTGNIMFLGCGKRSLDFKIDDS